ncbi:hypothetical protein MACJ_003778 [Theileria orientalis]|uniref:XTP/dITP diphosphatase n=1 Tax=Theileria orientalis TaxID=68886 RepID=A0A976XIG7_THEOR|nr:hypothetical protein MACJ_003778 [Theileria orientalis]
MEKKNILFCTSNSEKIRDLKHILGDEFIITTQPLDLTEIQGDPKEIALYKAKEAYEKLGKPVLTEDTCLCFNAFKGLPGPYVKFFLINLGVYGLYNLLEKFEDKTGYSLCTFGYADENGVKLFQGKTDGKIVYPRPPVDMGWNSIFEPEEEKNLISHRYRAALKLKNRAVRELPWRSRFDVLKQRIKPIYMSECPGTPRREYQENMINGIRIHPTFNPYVRLNKEKRYRLDNWPSRNWDDWNPHICYVRGGRKRHPIPKGFLPLKDELGSNHPPVLSGRYKADVEKQYYYNGLPWVWDLNYYTGKIHFHDREILFPKVWYRQAYRQKMIQLELKNLDKHLKEYKEHFKLKKRYSYYEKAVAAMAGEELASKYIRQRKIYKIVTQVLSHNSWESKYLIQIYLSLYTLDLLEERILFLIYRNIELVIFELNPRDLKSLLSISIKLDDPLSKKLTRIANEKLVLYNKLNVK